MALRDRISKTLGGAPVPNAECSVVLPYDALRPTLLDHPLCHVMSVDIERVHAAVVSAMRWTQRRRRAAGGDDVASTTTARARSKCTECGVGHELVDSKEGSCVCSHCGIVTLSNMNIEPEFVKPIVADRAAPRGIPGVSDQVRVRTTDGESRSEKRANRLWWEMENWNAYAHLGEDDLRSAHRTLMDWNPTEFSEEVSMCCALLLPLLESHVPDETSVRDALKSGKPLPVVRELVPEARFPCAKCGVKVHSAKDARLHCKLSIYAVPQCNKKRRL